jgi:hypothetical protein
MSERTVIAVVTDLIVSGLTVEQQILVNELALLAADTQRSADEKRAWREAKRVQRLSKDCPKTTPPSPPMINNSTPSPTPDLAKAKSSETPPLKTLFLRNSGGFIRGKSRRVWRGKPGKTR